MDGTPKKRRPPMPLPGAAAAAPPEPQPVPALNFLDRSEMEWGEVTEKRLVQPVVAQEIEGLVYKTFSLCPRCTLLEKKSDLALKSAHVLEQEGKVWLSVQCNIHGHQLTLLTANINWYKKMWHLASKKIESSGIQDIEDLKTKRKLTAATLPLVAELQVFQGTQFVSQQDIESQLRKISIKYPKGTQYVLKVTGRMSDDMVTLNNLILNVHSKTSPSTLIMIQVSYERLVVLVKLQNSCFLKGRIYPNVKYYLKKGDEKQCMDEFARTFYALKSFTGLKLVISLAIELPIPDLTNILPYLRRQHGFVQFIEIILERSPQELLHSIENGSTIPGVNSGHRYSNTMDPHEILTSIGTASKGSIAPEDFFPASMCTILEPFLPMFGYGKYQIRPSPHCGYGCCLVNSTQYQSTPISRILNFEKLYSELTPLVPELLKEGNLGVRSSMKLKSILDSCAHKGHELPNMISFITDKNKGQEIANFIEHLQFIVIHNHMDLTNMDMVRRCDCAALSKGNDGTTFFASCNYCI